MKTKKPIEEMIKWIDMSLDNCDVIGSTVADVSKQPLISARRKAVELMELATDIDNTKRTIKDIEDENEKLFSKKEWCEVHNMGWQASLYEQIYSHTRRIITKLKCELTE